MAVERALDAKGASGMGWLFNDFDDSDELDDIETIMLDFANRVKPRQNKTAQSRKTAMPDRSTVSA
jgi:hypothetical protein